MKTITIPKSAFKPKVFEYLRRVEQRGDEICLTARGIPVAKVISFRAEEERELNAMRGLVTHYSRPLDPVDVEWSVQQ